MRLGRLAERIAEITGPAAVILVPLVFNPWGIAYELPKVALFRGLTLLMAAAYLLALAWRGQRANPRRRLRRPLVLLILSVAGTAILSTALSINPFISLIGSYHRQQGAYLLLCLILWSLLLSAHLRTPVYRRRLVVAIAAAGSLVALTPFAEAAYWHRNPLTWRPGGSLGNPIFLGAYLIMTLPFTLYGLLRAARTEPQPSIYHEGAEGAEVKGGASHPLHSLRLGSKTGHRFKIGLWATAATLQAVALLVTQSRGPWLGGLVGLAVFGALTLGPGRRRWVLGGVAAALALAGLLVAGLRFGLVPGARISQLPYVRRIAAAADLSGGTVRVRLVLWRAAAETVARWPSVGLDTDPLRPLRPIVGYGPDTGSIVYTAVYSPELAHIEDPSAIWDRAHNETLDLLVMRGVLGVLAVAGLGVACLRQGLRLWRGASGIVERAAVAAPLAALVAHAVEVQFAFSVTATAMMAWLCVGMLASAGSKERGARGRERRAGNAGEPTDNSVPLRWRVYALVGAALLLAVVVRVEAASVWADTLVERARALDRAGQWDRSVDLYHRAHALAPWQPIYYQFHAEALYNLARALPEEATDLKIGLLEAADRNLAEARRLDPLELEYYANAGILHAYWSEAIDPDHLEMAVAFLEQAIRLAPTRVDLWITLAHVYHNHGMYEEALSRYQAALEIDPDAADAYYRAGMTYLALGRIEQAREAMEAALERVPDCEPCRSVLEELEE